jgi:hypothetical protein
MTDWYTMKPMSREELNVWCRQTGGARSPLVVRTNAEERECKGNDTQRNAKGSCWNRTA